VDNFAEVAPIVFSIGVFYSILVLSFTTSFTQMEQMWRRHEAAAGSSVHLICRNIASHPIWRWIVGKARRQEAPDDDEEDAVGPALKRSFTNNREDNRENTFFETCWAQVRTRRPVCHRPAAYAQRMFGSKLQ
jgi:hypothetical protein